MIGAKFPASFLLESALPSIATVVIIYVGRFPANCYLYWIVGWPGGIFIIQLQYDLLLKWRVEEEEVVFSTGKSIQSIPV
jgi:hypothetical protein